MSGARLHVILSKLSTFRIVQPFKFLRATCRGRTRGTRDARCAIIKKQGITKNLVCRRGA